MDASATDLIQRRDVEADVATLHQWHREHAVLAARSGKHAIVEKPMPLSLDDSDEMVAAFERSSTALLVGQTNSFGPAIRLTPELIEVA